MCWFVSLITHVETLFWHDNSFYLAIIEMRAGNWNFLVVRRSRCFENRDWDSDGQRRWETLWREREATRRGLRSWRELRSWQGQARVLSQGLGSTRGRGWMNTASSWSEDPQSCRALAPFPTANPFCARGHECTGWLGSGLSQAEDDTGRRGQSTPVVAPLSV